MKELKFTDKILFVIGYFVVFFLITAVCLPLITQGFGLDNESRGGMLILSVCQAFLLFIIPSLLAARTISRKPFSFLQMTNPPRLMPILGVVFAYLIAIPALNQIIFWNESLIFPENFSELGETLTEMEQKARNSSITMLSTESWGSMLVNLAVVAVITAFAEEIFFRGTLQTTLSSSGYPYVAIWVVAIFFSALHFQIFGFIPRLLLGAWFGYLLYWTRSLYIPIIAHFINNGVVVVFYWLNARGFVFDFEHFGVIQNGFPYPAIISAAAFIVFIIWFRKFFFYSSQNKWQTSDR